jgi:lysyl-tRNA synthetase class 2
VILASYLDLFRFIPGYKAHITDTGKEPLILLLLAFLITFTLTRLYTRLGRIRGWGSGSVDGVHLHHMVVGIVLVLLAGLAAIASTPDTSGHGRDIIGIVFGVGAAFVLDEFALSLYLRDVYWSPEGRSSVDACLLAVSVAGLVLVGVSPFGADQSAVAGRWAVFSVIGVNILCSLVSFLKGKLALGLLGVFIPLLGLVTAVRLAKPTSLWARRLYDARKMKRARTRFSHSRLRRLNRWFSDLVGGAPNVPADEPSSEH